ncbi:MAG: thiol reductase thioredoxin [Bacteroidales bacterium]|nr:thiol reductase thioredoxin [Bacteroidales bacterium]
MKKLLSFILIISTSIFWSCDQSSGTDKKSFEETVKANQQDESGSGNDIKPIYLTSETFREKVWDYETNPQEWVYSGEIPCVIDFYADWCKPCKMVAPIMDDLADYYDGRVIIYKVDTDKERELATVFQIRSIPSVLFSPVDGKPAMQPGAMKKEDYIKIIDEFVLKLNKSDNDKKES